MNIVDPNLFSETLHKSKLDYWLQMRKFYQNRHNSQCAIGWQSVKENLGHPVFLVLDFSIGLIVS